MPEKIDPESQKRGKRAGVGSITNLQPERKEQLSGMDKEQQDRVSQMIKLMK